MQKKTFCNHNWEKINQLLEKKQFTQVIGELKTIHVLDDLWLLVEAHIGLGDYDEVGDLITSWKFRISNLIQESHFKYYEAIVLLNKNSIKEAQILLKDALNIAISESDTYIKEKIETLMKNS